MLPPAPRSVTSLQEAAGILETEFETCEAKKVETQMLTNLKCSEEMGNESCPQLISHKKDTQG